MNSCVLMARVQEAPKLRRTPEGQPLTEMLVVFEGNRPDDPPSQLKVVAWGNLAEEVHQNYFAGDRVIITGRLKMMRVEREDTSSGARFREDRAELIASSLEKLSEMMEGATSLDAGVRPSNVIPMESYNKPTAEEPSSEAPEPVAAAPKAPAAIDEADLDDIPF